MTEGSVDDGNYLVLVRAQVMTRDDSSGGWVPMGGGGLSNVSVRKRILPSEEDSKHEYLICGKRISDQMVVLSCTIKKDFQYNKVMPTFHHWRTGDKKFGLTFQTAADARAFDKGVRVAVEDLDGSLGPSPIHDADVGDDDVFMAIELPVERGDSQSSSGSSSLGGSSGGGGGFGRPMSTTHGSLLTMSGGNGNEILSSPCTHSHHTNHQYFHRMHYISRPTQQRTNTPTNNNNNGMTGSGMPEPREVDDTTTTTWGTKHDEKLRGPDPKLGGPLRDGDKIETLPESYSYVQFARDHPPAHDYSYPLVDSVKGSMVGMGCGSGGGEQDRSRENLTDAHNKKLKGDVVLSQPPLLPTKSKWKRGKKPEKLKHLNSERARCKHCHEMFTVENNERGSCEYAPDSVRSCINKVSCISCAHCMLYHCMSDSEGDFAQHPCSCDRRDEHFSRRWLGLTILSLFVPCLWCYLPLNTCHRCATAYGVCGGRHEAS